MSQKTYVYKVYNSSTYLGNLKNVTSEFTYPQQINQAGAQLEIELGNKFDDVGATEVDDMWIDEAANFIVDESGNNLVFSKNFSFPNIPIDLANRIKVYCFYDNNVNGALVFDGLIAQWQTSYAQNSIKLTVLSYGVQLSNYIIASSSAGFAVDQEVKDTEHLITTDKSTNTEYAQSFTLGADTLVGSFSVWCYNTAAAIFAPLNWALYSGTPQVPGALLDTGVIPTTTTGVLEQASLTTPLTLPAGGYFIKLSSVLPGGSTSQPIIGSTTTAPYAGGKLFTRNSLATSTWTDTTEDLTFTINLSTGTQTLNFSSIDPGTIARTFMTQMQAQGSVANYSTSTIDLTSTTASYNFKIASGLDGLQKALSLAPDGWYWYYDIPTNMVHFHQVSQTAAHTLVLGKHFTDLNIIYSLETIVNNIHFSGGDTGGGSNLYSVYTSAPSISSYGKWTELLSDNRVTLQATADTIANGELNAKQNPLFQIDVTILDGVYDIETFTLGQMVQFRNFNNLLDNNLYQISRIERHPDYAILHLGTIPPRASNELQQAKNRLSALETIDNPSTPT